LKARLPPNPMAPTMPAERVKPRMIAAWRTTRSSVRGADHSELIRERGSGITRMLVAAAGGMIGYRGERCCGEPRELARDAG
jgi:hypothetical protein